MRRIERILDAHVALSGIIVPATGRLRVVQPSAGGLNMSLPGIERNGAQGTTAVPCRPGLLPSQEHAQIERAQAAARILTATDL